MKELIYWISVLEVRVFIIDRFELNKDVIFYIRFFNKIVFESVFEFLDFGNKGENISYWYFDDLVIVNN